MKTTRTVLTTDSIEVAGADNVTDLVTSLKGLCDEDDIMMCFDGNFVDRIMDYMIETDESCDDMIDYNENHRHELTNSQIIEVFSNRLDGNRK